MRILVTGGHGQLGRAVARRGTARGNDVVAPSELELDICDEASIARQLDTSAPQLVINAAAYTAVDRAESERERAFAVNADGATRLAKRCRALGIPFFHISTDYAFDGLATRPYREDDPTGPTGVYGESKVAGERGVADAEGTIVRTSWLFSVGGPSFVQTILRLAAERPVLRVVADQVGCPTWADDLADALLELGERRLAPAIYHYCNSGETSWHGFASAIVEEGRKHTTLACERIDAITTAEYPTAARRPAYSVLDTQRLRSYGIDAPSWRIGMARVIAEELA